MASVGSRELRNSTRQLLDRVEAGGSLTTQDHDYVAVPGLDVIRV